jgi:hypothetical protein
VRRPKAPAPVRWRCPRWRPARGWRPPHASPIRARARSRRSAPRNRDPPDARGVTVVARGTRRRVAPAVAPVTRRAARRNAFAPRRAPSTTRAHPRAPENRRASPPRPPRRGASPLLPARMPTFRARRARCEGEARCGARRARGRAPRQACVRGGDACRASRIRAPGRRERRRAGLAPARGDCPERGAVPRSTRRRGRPRGAPARARPPRPPPRARRGGERARSGGS